MNIEKIKFNSSSICVGVFALFLMAGTITLSAQETTTLAKPIYMQATMFGTSTQLGQMVQVTVLVNEFSTVDDQKALSDAFNAKGNEGLVNALSKMKTKGRVSMTGTLGYDVSYIRRFPEPDGSVKYRLVTNRPITFGEAWSDSRSMDYSLSGMEVIMTNQKDKKGKTVWTGTVAPACKFTIGKDKQIELELLKNPWNLVNIQIRK